MILTLLDPISIQRDLVPQIFFHVGITYHKYKRVCVISYHSLNFLITSNDFRFLKNGTKYYAKRWMLLLSLLARTCKSINWFALFPRVYFVWSMAGAGTRKKSLSNSEMKSNHSLLYFNIFQSKFAIFIVLVINS